MVIGPVGPETCALVPPKRAANRPTQMAPYRPAMGPTPEATPNAIASGRAMIAAVIPPKTSPRRLPKVSRLSLMPDYRQCGRRIINPHAAIRTGKRKPRTRRGSPGHAVSVFQSPK